MKDFGNPRLYSGCVGLPVWLSSVSAGWLLLFLGMPTTLTVVGRQADSHQQNINKHVCYYQDRGVGVC